MTDPAPERAPRLPYPHRRNDCGMCRERDADVQVIAPADLADPPRLFCQRCLGRFLAMVVLHRAGPQLTEASTYSLAIAPGRIEDKP